MSDAQTPPRRTFRTRSQPALQPTIEGYSLGRILGNGPTTTVFEGVLASHQLPVAVRVLHQRFSDSENFAARFLQAASVARQITDPRLPTCYDVGQSNGHVYIAEELIAGPSLATMLVEGPLDTEHSLRLGWAVAQVVETLHRAGHLHGRIHPGNIFPTSEDGVRLTGHGLPSPPAGDNQGANAEPSPARDIHGIGQVIALALGSDPTVDGRDDHLAAIVRHACAPGQGSRYQHVWHLREDLERAMHGFAPLHTRQITAVGSGVMPPTERTTRRVAQPRRATAAAVEAAPPAPALRRWLLPAVLAGVLVLAGAAIWLFRPVPAVPASRPAWASAAGVDAVGPWAELTLGGAVLRLRRVEPGSFLMGSPDTEVGRAADESRHLVTLTTPFWLGETEVTQAFAAASGRPLPALMHTGDRLPVGNLTWHDANALLAAVVERTGAPVRMPTEAEWEYAAQAGGRPAPVPAETDGPLAVGSRPANGWGFRDMEGNVAEWTSDTYGRYATEGVRDPLATDGTHRVARGGAWPLPPESSRPAARQRLLPTTHFDHVGLRLAISDAPGPRRP
jgi:hypothetical protein